MVSKLTSSPEKIPTTIKSKQLVEKKREQIIQAAIKLFPKKGYHRTTLRELADEAGISHGNIYDYVGNKEDIFLLVHDTLTGLADEALIKSTQNIQDPVEKLKRMIRSELELSRTWSNSILFVYQDIHVLSRPLLKKLLRKESDHVGRFKSVLQECVNKGQLRDCNTRLVANLIKIMIDCWVIKRWDLRGIGESEMENSIYNLVFNGLRNVEGVTSERVGGTEGIDGKRILFLNGGTIFGKAISSFLLSKGAILSIYAYSNNFIDAIQPDHLRESLPETARLYTEKGYGPMTLELFRKIITDLGQVDMIIQDLGISDIEVQSLEGKTDLSSLRLDTNMNLARNLFNPIQEEMNKRGSGIVLYLSPWAWDRHLDSLRYEMVKAETIALTRTLAKKLAESRGRVNCIIPGYIDGVKDLEIQGEEIRELLDRIPQGNLGEIQDVVEAAFFLVSDASKYMTGQVLELNGGIVKAERYRSKGGYY